MILKKQRIWISCLTVAIVCLAVFFSAFSFDSSTTAYATCDNADELTTIDSLLADTDIAHNYRLDRTLDVAYGKVYKLQQIFNGVDVYRAELSVSVDNGGNVLSKNGGFKTVQSVKKGNVTLEDAIDLVYSQFGIDTILASNTVIFPTDDGYVYAYELNCKGETNLKVYISQADGMLLHQVSLGEGVVVNVTQKDLLGDNVTIPVELDNGTYWMMDYERNMAVMYPTSMGYSMYGSSTSTFDDLAAVSAWNNVIKSYDYWADASNVGVSIRGVNNKNMLLYVFIHYGKDYENAAFVDYSQTSGYVAIEIGDGRQNGDIYLPARSSDTLGHEYTHGITNFTSGLEYIGESGALNEAFSDIFGALIEGNDPYDFEGDFWKIGEYAVPEGNECLRSLIGGTNGQYYTKDTMWVCEDRNHSFRGHDITCDYNGVHRNSTVITHVQYLINKSVPEYFTKEKIGQLWYATLCMLNSNADFDDFSEQFLQAAINLGFDLPVVDQVSKALYDNGLTDTYTSYSVGNYHSVIFQTETGKVLKRFIVPHGSSFQDLDLTNIAPVLEMNEQYEYSLSSWDTDIDSIDTINRDYTITAQYDWQLRRFTVRFRDALNNVIKEDTVVYGEAATPPTAPEKPSTTTYDYEFVGWSESYNEVTHDMDLTPIYNSIRYYMITLVSNGQVIDSLRLREGSKFSTDIVPTREPTNENTYTFIGWDKEIDTVNSDVTLNAKFEVKKRIYTVTYMSRGSVYQTIEYYYGEDIVLPEPDYRGMDFIGWFLNEDATNEFNGGTVTSDMILYAGWQTNYTTLIIVIAVVVAVVAVGSIVLVVVMKKKKKPQPKNFYRY